MIFYLYRLRDLLEGHQLSFATREDEPSEVKAQSLGEGNAGKEPAAEQEDQDQAPSVAVNIEVHHSEEMSRSSVRISFLISKIDTEHPVTL